MTAPVAAIAWRGTAAMRALMGYMLIGIVAVAAMGLVTVAGLGFAVGARPMPSGRIIQHVDRAHKADRLDTGATGLRPVPERSIAVPAGCEPIFSPLVAAGQLGISGRCVS